MYAWELGIFYEQVFEILQQGYNDGILEFEVQLWPMTICGLKTSRERESTKLCGNLFHCLKAYTAFALMSKLMRQFPLLVETTEINWHCLGVVIQAAVNSISK